MFPGGSPHYRRGSLPNGMPMAPNMAMSAAVNEFGGGGMGSMYEDDFYGAVGGGGGVGSGDLTDMEYQQNMMMMQQQMQMQQMQMQRMQQERMRRMQMQGRGGGGGNASGAMHRPNRAMPPTDPYDMLPSLPGRGSGMGGPVQAFDDSGHLSSHHNSNSHHHHQLHDPYEAFPEDPLLSMPAQPVQRGERGPSRHEQHHQQQQHQEEHHHDNLGPSPTPIPSSAGAAQYNESNLVTPSPSNEDENHNGSEPATAVSASASSTTNASLPVRKGSAAPSSLKRRAPDRNSSGLLSVQSMDAHDGEITLEEYRQQLEAYLASNQIADASKTNGNTTGTGTGGEESDLEDDWEREKEKAMQENAVAAAEPRRRGVGRNISGCSFMSSKTTKSAANMSLVSGISLSDIMSTTSREQKMSAARSVGSNLSLMSEISDLSANLDDLSI